MVDFQLAMLVVRPGHPQQQSTDQVDAWHKANAVSMLAKKRASSSEMSSPATAILGASSEDGRKWLITDNSRTGVAPLSNDLNGP